MFTSATFAKSLAMTQFKLFAEWAIGLDNSSSVAA
jgi:hypothetical protein